MRHPELLPVRLVLLERRRLLCQRPVRGGQHELPHAVADIADGPRRLPPVRRSLLRLAVPDGRHPRLLMNAPAHARPLAVREGRILAYRQLDVADEIDLVAAERVIRAGGTRRGPLRGEAARSLLI